MNRNLPRLLLCAPNSGSGKTTVTCAVLQALVNQGMNPVSFKCGPDYIDPMFHSEVIGAKSRNLDLFFMGEQDARYLLWENGRVGDLCVMEGAMGYYDGIAITDKSSAWDMARKTQTPAVLVIDARGSALTLSAVIKGIDCFRAPSLLGGVILNRISKGLYPRLKACIEGETGVPVLGFLENLPGCTLESRHLGLVTAAEVGQLREKLQALAAEAVRTIDIDGLMRVAESAPALAVEPPELPEAVSGNPRIAVARDKAFCFYYEDNLTLLQRMGAQLQYFSPIHDEALPKGCGGLYLGGGYPELYGKALADNGSMRVAIQKAVSGGMPTVAECGGFLYLHRTMEDADGISYPMAGVYPYHAFQTKRLQRFGYITLRARKDGLLGNAGTQIPAHEFHYWDSDAPGADFLAQKPDSSRHWDCGYTGGHLYAGFPHIHFWGAKNSARRFVAAAVKYHAAGGNV